MNAVRIAVFMTFASLVGGCFLKPTTTSSSVRTSTSLCTADDTALATNRMPLARIFSGERDYLFTTRKNLRSFEWTAEEAEDLFESLLALDDGSDDALELNAITIMVKPSTKEEKRKLEKKQTSMMFMTDNSVLCRSVCF